MAISAPAQWKTCAMKFATLQVHAGITPDPITGSIFDVFCPSERDIKLPDDAFSGPGWPLLQKARFCA